jgi:hypothetical protein
LKVPYRAQRLECSSGSQKHFIRRYSFGRWLRLETKAQPEAASTEAGGSCDFAPNIVIPGQKQDP